MKWSKAPKKVRSDLMIQGVYGLAILICTVMMFTGDVGLDPLVLGYGRIAGCFGTLLAVERIVSIVLTECMMQHRPELRELQRSYDRIERECIREWMGKE